MQRRRIRTGEILASFKREAPRAVQNAFEEGVKQWKGVHIAISFGTL